MRENNGRFYHLAGWAMTKGRHGTGWVAEDRDTLGRSGDRDRLPPNAQRQRQPFLVHHAVPANHDTNRRDLKGTQPEVIRAI